MKVVILPVSYATFFDFANKYAQSFVKKTS